MKYLLIITVLFALNVKAFEDATPVAPDSGIDKFVVGITTDTRTAHCTGIVLSNKHVLTSALCFGYFEGENHTITTGLDINNPTAVFKIKKTVLHPSYTVNDWNPGSDLAIVEIQGTFPSSMKAPELFQGTDSELMKSELNITIFGYGGHKVTDEGILRSFTNNAARESFNSEDRFRFDNTYKLRFCDRLVNGVSPGRELGDHGAPLTVVKNGKIIVLGTLSGASGYSLGEGYGNIGNCRGNHTLFTPVNDHIEWITSVIR